MTNVDTKTQFPWKLWIYTNFDCNLSCSYCVAESTPRALRRAIGLDNALRLVDEAVELGFQELFFTGGEPFILDEIYDMLAYSSARVKTTVLTNAMLFNSHRLQRLRDVANSNLIVQVSLDGAHAEAHDAYRGVGTWVRTVAGIETLLANGFHVRLSTTETLANSDHLHELIAFRQELGIAEADHFIRPLAKRGFSQEGVEVGIDSLVPEITITKDGVYWHPLVSPESQDMLVMREIFPLATAVSRIQAMLTEQQEAAAEELLEFT